MNTIPFPPIYLRGYTDVWGDGKLQDTKDIEVATLTPDGGVISNIYDLAVLYKAIVEDRSFLLAAAFSLMITPGTDDPTNSFGLGVMLKVNKDNNHTWVQHKGNCSGYTSFAAYCLETGTIITATVNADYGKFMFRFASGLHTHFDGSG